MIFVSDLDGTLLGSDHKTIAKDDIAALNAFVEKGGRFWVASGRPCSFLKELNRQGLYPEYMIGSTGSVVSDGKDEVLISGIRKEEGLRMIAFLDGVEGLDYTIDANTPQEYAKAKYGNFARHMQIKDLGKLNILKPDTFFEDHEVIFKFFVMCASDELALEVMAKINEDYGDDFKAFHADHKSLEVVSAKTNKWYGIEYLLKKHGLDTKELACIGDEGNDLEMIRHAALGFCVQWANEEVKRNSDHVVGSVKEAIAIIERRNENV